MRLVLLPLAIHPENGTPAPGYLIQTDDGRNILIDTGFPRQFEIPGSDGRRLDEQFYVVNQLAQLGLTPTDIQYLVCTHFDQDHAGGHDAFPTAELVVQRQHYAVARAGNHPRFERMRSHWDHSDLRYRLIDGDHTLVPGVELIATSGHVPGHQSVLVRLPQTGPVILAIDAVTQAAHFALDRTELGPHDMDAEETLTSTHKLVTLAQQEQAALVIFGHDAAHWRTLRTLPDAYA